MEQLEPRTLMTAVTPLTYPVLPCCYIMRTVLVALAVWQVYGTIADGDDQRDS